MLHLSEFVWILRSSVLVVIKNFLLLDATDWSKIRSDQKRFFIALSLYPLSFFANTHFNKVLFYHKNCTYKNFTYKNCTYKIVHLKNCLTITFFLSVSSEFFFRLFVCSSNSSMRLKCKFNSFLILEAYLTLGLPG